MTIAHRGVIALSFLLSASCTVSLDDEHLEDLSPLVTDVRPLCVHTPPDGVSQGSALSLAFPTGSAFVFGDTLVEQGTNLTFLSNTEALAEDPTEPCKLEYVRDVQGDLVVPIDLSAEEIVFDLGRTDGRRTALWPIGGFVAGETGYVFYRKLAMAGYFDIAEIGTGVARFQPGQPAVRLSVQHFTDEPLLTWLSPNADWGTGALLGNDGLAYVYGCFQLTSFDVGCRVARVEPDRVADPDAYRYYASDGEWTERVERATRVIDGALHLSGFYSAHLGRYVFVYSEFLGNRIYVRTAPEPWGPFDEPVELSSALPPKNFWIERADVHPGFGSADGKRFVLSYYTDNSANPGLHFEEGTLR